MAAHPTAHEFDAVIVGAGAAGLATAIFAARRAPGPRIALLDGATKLGAKILVAGGGRCNVTNVRVTADDFRGGSRRTIARVLAAFPEREARAFFEELGVGLHEEEDGKLFPDTNKARTVLDALLGEATRRGVTILAGRRVLDVERTGERGFRVVCGAEAYEATRLVLATGGLSLPKTGSDGAGYAFARKLGHTLLPTTPALAPLVLDGALHAGLAGVSHEVELSVLADGEKPARFRGALLWTHFGVSGPAVLNASGAWHRARLTRPEVCVSANFLPGQDFAAAERGLLERAAAHPRQSIQHALAERLPQRVAAALLGARGVDAQTPLAHLARENRRRLLNALLAWPLRVRESRGYAHAEVTAGGVPLAEIDPATMASRCCPGLHLVGEILDVDGRIGGFNFQWAWSSGYVAGKGVTDSELRIANCE